MILKPVEPSFWSIKETDKKDKEGNYIQDYSLWNLENENAIKTCKNEEVNHTLENYTFNPEFYMVQFLAKAMSIIVSNFGYKYVNSDMEWWYKEYLKRQNENKEPFLDGEVAQKLLDLFGTQNYL